MYSVVGVVKEIDKTNRTCTVEPIDESAMLYEVRLQADIGNSIGCVVFPKLESDVLVTFLNKHTGYISLCSEVERIELVIDTLTIKADKKGVLLQRGQSDIKTELNNLFGFIDGVLDTLINFKVNTASGPSVSLFPDTLTSVLKHKADLPVIKTKINQLFQ
jgi:hypothetical protein